MSKLVLLGSLAAATAACYSPDRTMAPFAPAPGSPLAVAGGPQNVAAGDLNRDGKPDLVVACSKGHLAVLLGDGKGGFRPAPGSPLKYQGGELGLGDVNGDGRLDLALADHDSYDVTVLLGDGKGGFAPAPGSPFAAKKGESPHTHGLALADLNGDGKPDLVTANNDDNDVAVLLGDGTGGFRPAPGSPFAVGPSPYPPAVGDVNGDGRVDVVAPNTTSKGSGVTVLLGDGKGGFAPARGSPVPTAERPYYLALGDVNGDGRPDVVVAHDDDTRLTVLVGDGKGGFAPAPGPRVELGARPFGVVVADVDKDGKPDVLAAAGEAVRVLLGDGRGSFSSAHGSPFAAGKGCWRLAVADLDGDGRADVAATGLESDTVTVLLGR